MIGQWLDIIRREAQHVHFHGAQKSTLICTSYNKDTHAVKGILVPHGVETGWVPIGVAMSGNGYGILTGPKVGSADKLDGDQFDIEFEFGDHNSPMAVMKRFSIPDKPPAVESGEILMQHESGNKFFFAKDKSMTWAHYKGGSHVWDKNGKLTIKTNDQDVTIDAGKGSHHFVAQNINLKGTVGVQGDINQTGNLNQTGNTNSTGQILGAAFGLS